MTLFKNLFACAVVFSGLAVARPLRRQAAANATGLTDMQILQFALTLEHLESTFYQQGFAMFPAADFKALGLDDATIAGLQAIGATEATHVTVLSDTITSLGGTPVPACTYNFNLVDAASMVATARVLEAVGISAYLGAAPLVSEKAVLSAAASIVTVEARHQTFIRTSLKAMPVPQAFDVAIGPLQIFTLASGFIQSCPPEANLGLTALPPLNILDAANIRAGSTLKMVVTDPTGGAGMSCSFTSGDKGLQFAKFENGGCVVPDGLGGEVFMTVTTESEGVTALADDKIVAGPAVLIIS